MNKVTVTQLSRHASRIVRACALILVGLFIVIPTGGFFAPISSLHILLVVLRFTWLLSLLPIVSGILILIERTRIQGYILAIAVSGALTICSFISLGATKPPHSPIVFLFPVLWVAYLEGLATTVNDKFNSVKVNPDDQKYKSAS